MDKTKVDHWLTLAKNHKFLSIIIFSAIILGGIASISDSVTKIIKVFKKKSPEIISVSYDIRSNEYRKILTVTINNPTASNMIIVSAHISSRAGMGIAWSSVGEALESGAEYKITYQINSAKDHDIVPNYLIPQNGVGVFQLQLSPSLLSGHAPPHLLSVELIDDKGDRYSITERHLRKRSIEYRWQNGILVSPHYVDDRVD